MGFGAAGAGVLVTILLIGGALTLIGALTVLIYRAVYTRSVNRRLAAHSAGTQKQKGMISPFHLLVSVLAALALTGTAVIAAAALGFFFFRAQGTQPADTAPAFEFETLYPQYSPIAGCTPEDEISGYTRFTAESGDVTFVYYLCNNRDSAFPQLLICAEYTGETEGMHLVGALEASSQSSRMGGCCEMHPTQWFVLRANAHRASVSFSLKVMRFGAESYQQYMQSADGARFADATDELSGDLDALYQTLDEIADAS